MINPDSIELKEEPAMPKLIARYSATVEIWLMDGEYYVYGVYRSGDPRVCPSESMARDVAAGAV